MKETFDVTLHLFMNCGREILSEESYMKLIDLVEKDYDKEIDPDLKNYNRPHCCPQGPPGEPGPVPNKTKS